MGSAAYFLDKARQCRRLARATGDDRTVVGLTAMAEEFEAQAKSIEDSPVPSARDDTAEGDVGLQNGDLDPS